MSKSKVYSLKSPPKADQPTADIVYLIISAILLSLSFSSFSAVGGSASGGNLDLLIWFGFVPLFFALEDKNKLQTFFISFFCGFLFFAISMYWLIHVTLPGWILLSLYQALYFGIFGLFVHYIFKQSISHKQSTINYFLLPSAWVILEYIRSNLGGGIGWNLLAYSQYKNLPVIQISDISGAYGVSFVIMLVNVVVYSVKKMAIKCFKTDPEFKIRANAGFVHELKSHPVIPLLSAVIVISIVLVYGYTKLSASIQKQMTESIKVSVIQGNIAPSVKWDAAFKKETMDIYSDLTFKASLENPDIIIWPETAVPGFLNYDQELMLPLKNIIEKARIPVLTGIPTANESNLYETYNSAVLFSKNAKILDAYNKIHLVAFGEFIPFDKQFPALRKILPPIGDFIPGAEYTIFKIPADFSVLVCFEDVFPNLVRRFVRKGAGFMVVITNDSWFFKTCAAYQHAANSVFRAVENRRPFVRSTNTGFSCFIDKNGGIYEKVSKDNNDLFIRGIKTAVVDADFSGEFSFYTKYGDVFVTFCIIILVISIIRRMFLTI